MMAGRLLAVDGGLVLLFDGWTVLIASGSIEDGISISSSALESPAPILV